MREREREGGRDGACVLMSSITSIRVRRPTNIGSHRSFLLSGRDRDDCGTSHLACAIFTRSRGAGGVEVHLQEAVVAHGARLSAFGTRASRLLGGALAGRRRGRRRRLGLRRRASSHGVAARPAASLPLKVQRLGRRRAAQGQSRAAQRQPGKGTVVQSHGRARSVCDESGRRWPRAR